MYLLVYFHIFVTIYCLLIFDGDYAICNLELEVLDYYWCYLRFYSDSHGRVLQQVCEVAWGDYHDRVDIYVMNTLSKLTMTQISAIVKFKMEALILVNLMLIVIL